MSIDNLTKSEIVVEKILTRCNNKQSLETQLFLGGESVKQYGKELLYYIATEIAPESREKILAVELT